MDLNKEGMMLYTFDGKTYDIPNEFLFKSNYSKEWSVSEEFFTWAFDKHEVSTEIVKTETIHAHFVIQMKATYKGTMMRTSLGDVPEDDFKKDGVKAIQTALRRAKVNVGKEVFGLTEMKNVLKPYHYIVPNGEFHGISLGVLYESKGRESIETLKADADFRTQQKAKELLEWMDSKEDATPKQLERLTALRNTHNIPASYYSKLTETVFEKDFSYKDMSYVDASLLIDILIRKYEKKSDE